MDKAFRSMVRGILVFGFAVAMFIVLDGPTRAPIMARIMDFIAVADIIFVTFMQFRFALLLHDGVPWLLFFVLVAICPCAVAYILENPFSFVTAIVVTFLLPVYVYYLGVDAKLRFGDDND